MLRVKSKNSFIGYAIVVVITHCIWPEEQSVKNNLGDRVVVHGRKHYIVIFPERVSEFHNEVGIGHNFVSKGSVVLS